MTSPLLYYRTAELPTLQVWWRNAQQGLVDMSTADLTVKVGRVGTPAIFTKTTGITGAAGSGTSTAGTPNVTINWSTGELDVTPGAYTLQVTASFGGGDRVLQYPIRILEVVE